MNVSSRSKIACLIFIALFQFSVNAQTNLFTLEASQVISNFKFVDSEGKVDNNYSSVNTGAYGIGYRHIMQKGLLFRLNIGIRKAGSSLAADNNSYRWDLQYLEAKAGLGYMLNKWKLKPYLIVSPYYAALLKANQSVNSQNYDIIDNNSIKKSDYGLVFTPGLQFDLSDAFAVFAEYNYIYGLQNNEVSGKQKLYIFAHSVSLGVAVKFSKQSPKWVQEK